MHTKRLERLCISRSRFVETNSCLEAKQFQNLFLVYLTSCEPTNILFFFQIENLKKALGTEEWNNVSNSGAKEIKSPFSRPIATTERTPPRLRRLSIENCSNTKANLEDRKGIKSPLASRRAQRLSLEGPKSYKNEENSKVDPTTEVHQLKNPRSPISSYQNRAVKVDGRTSIPQLQLLQTPVKGASRNDIQMISVDSRTNGKGSQIRKSLRTIGKLINGSEKRYDKDFTSFKSA